ncbi:MAG: anaerobic ribonucleoside-triphosphate reductase [archaeon]
MVKTKCEVYSRVVGYIRPVQQWNDSKQAEFHDRLKFDSATAPNTKDSCGCVKLKC